ncbi:MAG: hypothetical protein KAS90_06730 [Candidatus Aenigmarchaeota archaeon]|nr:hypothetical protein [Candidatus Aenigmarchaeota archaeon]
MSGELNGDGCIVYATEVPGINDDGSNYDTIYPDKVTAFQNMTSIGDRNPHNENLKLKDNNIPYMNLTDDELLEMIIESSLYLLSEKYGITPGMFIDSNDKYLPHNMDHFENEIVDIINELSDEISFYNVENAPLYVLLVAETLKKYADDIANRDEIKTNNNVFNSFQLFHF